MSVAQNRRQSLNSKVNSHEPSVFAADTHRLNIVLSKVSVPKWCNEGILSLVKGHRAHTWRQQSENKSDSLRIGIPGRVDGVLGK